MTPLYDNEDSVCGIIYNGSAYYFYKNLQGDIIEIANRVGTIVARYSYDAWGKVTAITDGTGVDISNNVGHVANANPFRYRGYYYDAEIGMYYLQSRYYDSKTGIFLNFDDSYILQIISSIGGYNLRSYCNNNPVKETDHSGYAALSFLIDLILGGVCGFVIQIFSDIISYLFNRYICRRKNYEFQPKVSDYVASILTWAFTFVNPLGKWKYAKHFSSVIPFVIKYCIRLVEKAWDWSDFIVDFVGVVLSIITSFLLDRRRKNELQQLKDKRKNNNYNLDVNKERMKIKSNNNKLGNIFNFTFNFSPSIVQMLLSGLIGI